MADTSLQTYTLVITGAPYSSQAPQTALAFARAAQSAGHTIGRVFLYGDGVHLASALACSPSDEPHWPRLWSQFVTQHGIPAFACVASALRRGIVDSGEQQRYELPACNVQAPFEIAGLGEWVDASTRSNVLYFHSGA